MEDTLRINKAQILNEFALKIISLVLMTIDHIGVFLLWYAEEDNSAMILTGDIFRIIGRLAFPLFIFMLVEGIFKSKNVHKYILRLLIADVIVIAFLAIIYYCFDHTFAYPSPFNDLLINGLILMLLLDKRKWAKALAILPLAYLVLNFAVDLYELKNPETSILWLPFYLRTGYGLFGLMLALGYYSGHMIARKIMAKTIDLSTVDNATLMATKNYISIVNMACLTTTILANIIIYLAMYLGFDVYIASIQTWSIFAGIFFIFYDGKRGYNAKWFQYGSYFYFVVHLIIIYAIFYLIYLV